MVDKNGLMRGTNFSHWLSQTDLSREEHLENAIRVEDFKRMAGYGADHVRLPVDFQLIESRRASGVLNPDGVRHVDRAIQWAKQAGLNLILDLHSAPGMSFFTPEENDIWTNREHQERFAGIWRELAVRFKGEAEHLAFELVNEPTATENADWNRIAAIGLEAVRSVDKDRLVLIGSNSWSSPHTFPDLEDFGDPAVLYTFHFYDPFIFTHQKASWVDHLKMLNLTVEYPSTVPDLFEAADAMPTAQMREQTLLFSKVRLDAERLKNTLEPVLQFRQRTGAPVYCGEFGTIKTAPLDSQMRWYEDVVDLFGRHGIGWANWDYKGGFGILEPDRSDRSIRQVLFPD